MVCKKCGKACTCAVKKKRKAAVRRAPARSFKGTTSTMAPGLDISSLVRLVSDLTAKKPEQTIIPPAVTIGIPEAAKGIPRGVSVGTGTDTSLRNYGTQTFGIKSMPRIEKPVGISVGTETMKRTTPYKSGFMSILPEVQKAAAIAERAIASKTFTQTTGAGTRTLTVPQVEALFEQGQVIRPTGGRLTNAERQARELERAAAQAAQETAGNVEPK